MDKDKIKAHLIKNGWSEDNQFVKDIMASKNDEQIDHVLMHIAFQLGSDKGYGDDGCIDLHIEIRKECEEL